MRASPSQTCSRAPLDVLANASLVPIDLIVDAPGQPRTLLPDIEALALNIERYGLLQPVALRRVDGRYQIIAGHRRVRAFRRLREQYPSEPQWSSISAMITRSNDETAALSMVSAQVHSVGWSAEEEATVLERLVRFGLNQHDVAVMLQRTDGWISKRIRAYNDPAIGIHVRGGVMAPTIGEELLSVRNTAERRELATRAVHESWSQSRARSEARKCQSDRLVREIGRRTRALTKDLRWIDTSALTNDVLSDLEKLAMTIERLVPRAQEAKPAA